ncbi:CLUMA_CG005376, isoform A [Clunio marinus]|uniref:CLUMA_CG005376, isoform A n=1 Tax=Clunio marinus TaxID=568069 RepID=A0A1J1HYX6_9DIPT|nr:CLUMA_CG005376, isoform A [Clunio marinus]
MKIFRRLTNHKGFEQKKRKCIKGDFLSQGIYRRKKKDLASSSKSSKLFENQAYCLIEYDFKKRFL